MNVISRNYAEDSEAQAVGELIPDTYRKFNLQFAPPGEQEKLLGPFSNARSDDPVHRQAITRILRTEMILVAVLDRQIVGVLRCRSGRLQSLFVREDYHRQGIGRRLVEV